FCEWVVDDPVLVAPDSHVRTLACRIEPLGRHQHPGLEHLLVALHVRHEELLAEWLARRGLGRGRRGPHGDDESHGCHLGRRGAGSGLAWPTKVSVHDAALTAYWSTLASG